MARKQAVDERLHSVFEKRAFGCATSQKKLDTLVAAVNARAKNNKDRYIKPGCAYFDPRGGRAAFQELIETSGQDGHTGDLLHIPSLAALGRSIAEVKEKLQVLKSVGMTLYTMYEREQENVVVTEEVGPEEE